MGKLVADGADTHVEHPFLAVQFGADYLVAARIGVNGDTIEVQRLISTVAQGIFVWPDRIFVAASGLSLSGIDDVDLFHFTVIIPVIVGKVDLIFDGIAGVDHHLRCVSIIPIVGMSAVISIGMVEGDRAGHVKGEVELAVALIEEIVVHAADGTALGVGIAVLVEHVVIECLDICLARAERQHISGVDEILVAELHEDDESFFLARNHRRTCADPLCSLTACLCIQGFYLTERCGETLFVGLAVVTRMCQHIRGDEMSAADMCVVVVAVVGHYRNTVVGDSVVEVLIAYEFQPERGAVGLTHGAPHRHGRYGKERGCK